jgi:hypothetical protein
MGAFEMTVIHDSDPPEVKRAKAYRIACYYAMYDAADKQLVKEREEFETRIRALSDKLERRARGG